MSAPRDPLRELLVRQRDLCRKEGHKVWSGSQVAALIDAVLDRFAAAPSPSEAGLREATERLRGGLLAEAIRTHRDNMQKARHPDGSRVDAMEEDTKLYDALSRYEEAAALSVCRRCGATIPKGSVKTVENGESCHWFPPTASWCGPVEPEPAEGEGM